MRGEVAALFSDLEIFSSIPDTAIFPEDQQRPEETLTPQLASATNIIVYALTRPQGLTRKMDRPLWMEIASR